MNNYYHILNVGLHKERLFFDEADYSRFVGKIYKYQKKYKDVLKIGEWCLLPNSFHFLILSLKDGLVLSNFMRDLQISHSLYIKKKYNLGGRTLFDGRYKSIILNTGKILYTCRQYILMSPVIEGYVDKPDEWKWYGCF